eukprot:UN18128
MGKVTKIDIKGVVGDSITGNLYRSCLPLGTYDLDKSVLDKWEKLKFDHIICFIPESEFLQKCGKTQSELYGSKYKSITNLPFKNHHIPQETEKTLLALFDELLSLLKNKKNVVLHCRP